jgi:bifunctional UDP-N-acetylglucosamine pyrophosphorylase / glucosamine-1-phosphate N-acetyltransferase
MVAYGDMPLYKPETYRKLAETHRRSGAACTLLTARTCEMQDYGRVIRDKNGLFQGIVEMKDCTPEQAAIGEVNPGVYVFQGDVLFNVLKKLRSDNAQGEYYLTDVPQLIREEGFAVETLTIQDDRQIRGVNTPEDLAVCENILLER